MTPYTKSLLSVTLKLIGFAAILVCAALFVWSCDGSQFGGDLNTAVGQRKVGKESDHSLNAGSRHHFNFPGRVVSSGHPSCLPSLSMRTESGDCCTFRLAVGATDSAAEFTRGIGRDSRDVAHVGCESVAKNRTPLDTLHGTGSEEKD